MAIIKIEKTKDYTIMSNYHLRDKELSLKAKGLLSLMLSLPNNWNYSVQGLVAICKENETAINSALNELKTNKYLKVYKVLPNKDKGRTTLDYLYMIYEKPNDTTLSNEDIEKFYQGGGFLGVDNLGVDNLGVENRVQYNTNILNTNKVITYNKDNLQEKLLGMLKEKTYSQALKDKIIEWLNYKKEKRETYKELGFKGFLNKIDTFLKDYSEELILQSIDNSISNNYQGVFIIKGVKPKNETQKAKDEFYTDEKLAQLVHRY
jgi:hypothetical protein